MNKHVPIEAPLLIHYIEGLFREGHCLVTALLLPAEQEVAVHRHRVKGRPWVVLERTLATRGARVNKELTSR